MSDPNAMELARLHAEVTSLLGEKAAERKGIRLLLAGQQVGCSMGVGGETTYGYGDLDDGGYWQYPVPEELVLLQRRTVDLATRLNELEAKYRKKLWAAHAHPFSRRYGDDGEMQCQGFDFKRASLEDCEKHCNDAAMEGFRRKDDHLV